MKKVLRKSKFGYALSLILFFLGISAIIIAFWRIWLRICSADSFISAFWNLLWTEKFDFILGVSFKLIFLFVFGIVAIVFGGVVWAFSRKWFLVGDKKFLLSAPSAKGDGKQIRRKH